MKNIILSVIFGCVAIIGLLRLIIELMNVSEKRDFAKSFLEKLQEYMESNGREMGAYGWIISHSNKMQNQMGFQGVYAHYRPLFQNYLVKNYPVIINMIPELRNALEMELEFFSGRLANRYFNALQDAIIRHIGSVDDIIIEIKRELKNPFIWLREGVRVIIAIPVSLLVWLGVITASLADKIKTSALFKISAGLVATIGFISAIVTIILGWDDFFQKIKNLLSQ